jgi:hypothetical protein
VPHWYPTWQQAVLAALLLATAGRLLRKRRPGPAAFLFEAGILIGLFGLWQLAGHLAAHAPTGAVAHGEQVWDLERTLHLPSEASVQTLLLPHHVLVQLFNGYYAYAHVNSLLLTLLWVFLRHRDSYAWARTVVALTTFACLAVQLIPVVPPRLLPTGGAHAVVDTATVYGQSVYGPLGQGLSDQFAAMPSVHIAWASAVAVLTYRLGRGAGRYLGPAHLVLTTAVVVGTGNHYWLDGVVAALLLAAAMAVATAAGRLQPAVRVETRQPLEVGATATG